MNIWKPIAESASCRYVERRVVNATGAPPTVPRQLTRPYLVRLTTSWYEPAAVQSAAVGFQESVFSRLSIAVHWPVVEVVVRRRGRGAAVGSQSCTAYVSVMSCTAEVALHA